MAIRRLDERTIHDIENALMITFHDWQWKYLLKKPEVLDLRITGRCTGKTLTNIIELLFKEDSELDLSSYDKAAMHCDWGSIERDPRRIIRHPYPNWFIHEVKEIYTKLNDAGIQTRPVIFKRDVKTGNVNDGSFIDLRTNNIKF